MTAVLFLGATLAFALACLLYYKGRFLAASLLGLAYGLVLCALAFPAMHPVLWSLVVTLLLVFPALLIGLHVVDLRTGLFLLPTVYSIPFAFLAAAFLWVFCGFSLLWSVYS